MERILKTLPKYDAFSDPNEIQREGRLLKRTIFVSWRTNGKLPHTFHPPNRPIAMNNKFYSIQINDKRLTFDL